MANTFLNEQVQDVTTGWSDVGSAVTGATGNPFVGTAAGVTWYAGEQLVDFLEAALRRRVYATAGGPALPVGKTSYDDIIAQGAIILKSVSKGAGSNKKTGKFLNTPDKVRRDILLEKKKQPTLEELDQAVVRGGNEVQGWRYDRSSVEGFSDDLAKQLQKEFGGTDAQRDAFQTLQKKAKSDLVKDIKALNKKMQFDYLEFANTAVQEGERLGRKLTDEDIYEIFLAMANNPKNADMFDLGHNISAKNVARQKRKGKLTTADYKSNMDIEIKKSIKDLIFRESKSGQIIPKTRTPMETGTNVKDSNVNSNSSEIFFSFLSLFSKLVFLAESSWIAFTNIGIKLPCLASNLSGLLSDIKSRYSLSPCASCKS